MAGPQAEFDLDPNSFDRGPSRGDYGQINGALHIVEGNSFARKLLFKSAARQLDVVLNDNWKSLQRVAFELQQQRTLTGDDVRAIMDADEVGLAA